MKTGTIVYVAQAGTLPAEWAAEQALGETGLDPRWTELAGSALGFYRPEEALLALAQRGAARVDLVGATCDDRHAMKLNSPRTRWVG